MNAAPVEIALTAKEKGLTVVAVTSVANRKINQPTHSSGKSLHDAADIVIDNCSPAEDALVGVEGLTLMYRGHRGLVAEVFRFGTDRTVVEVSAHYVLPD